MNKLLMTTAIIAAAGLTACNQGSDSTAGGVSENYTQTASAKFSASFPESEAGAALISGEAASIELQVLPIHALLTSIEQCMMTGSYPLYCATEGDTAVIGLSEWGYQSMEDVLYEVGELYEIYKSLDADSLKEMHVRYFSAEVTEAMQFLVNNNVWSQLPLESAVIERSLTPQNNTTTINQLFTGAYVMLADQRTASDERIAYEVMTAWLGEGENTIPFNLMSGTWTAVNSLGQPQTISLDLLGSSFAAEWDWDPLTAGNQNVIEAVSEGDASSAALASIHYLNHGKPPFDMDEPPFYQPVNFIFDLNIQTPAGSEQMSLREYDDLMDGHHGPYSTAEAAMDDLYGEITGSVMEGMFYQAYDARLAGNTVQGGMYNFEIEVFDDRGMSAGAFILDEMLPELETSNDGSGNRVYSFAPEGWEYENETSYQLPDGSWETLYYITKENAAMTWRTPNDQMDIATLEPMTVTGGNRIDGVMIEYIARRLGLTQTGTSPEQAEQYAPSADHAVMGLAMNRLASSAGLSAQASSHPLGSQCVAVDEIEVETDIVYAWVDGQWQAGSINWSYNVVDGAVRGVDMNGNGTVEFFETGVVLNWGELDMYCTACDDMALRYRIHEYTEDGETRYEYAAYQYISEEELASQWTQVLGGDEEPMLGYYENSAGDVIKLETIYDYDEGRQIEALYRVNDLDGDGVVEFYENVAGKNREYQYELHICSQAVRFSGAALSKPLDDFLYDMENTIDLTGRTASSVITASFCAESITGGWDYSFSATQMTLTGTDSFDSSAGFENCVVGEEESFTLTMDELGDMDIPFNCHAYPICGFSELNRWHSGVDEDDRPFESSYEYDADEKVLIYTNTKTETGETFTEVITIN